MTYDELVTQVVATTPTASLGLTNENVRVIVLATATALGYVQEATTGDLVKSAKWTMQKSAVRRGQRRRK